MTKLASIIWLVVVWVALWGRLSVANVLSGVVVAIALLAVLPLPRASAGERPVVRPLALAWLAVYFAAKLVQANVVLTRRILAVRAAAERTAVIAVPLRPCSDTVLTIVANMTALVPGTMTVEVDRDPTNLTFYVHVLSLTDIDAVRRDVQTLQALALRALAPRTSAP